MAAVCDERHPVPAAHAAQLYERHHRRILAYCHGRLRDRQEAEDAVQNTFVYAFKLPERGVEPETELPWLYTIAHNVCRSRRRDIGRRARVEMPADIDAFQDVIGAPSDAAADELAGLSQALAAVPETQRRALLLREWRGLSYAEIATTLSLSHSAVETLLFRARRSLAKQLVAGYNRAAVMVNGLALFRLARRIDRVGSPTRVTAAAIAAGAVAAAGLPLAHTLRHEPSPPIPHAVFAATAPSPPAVQRVVGDASRPTRTHARGDVRRARRPAAGPTTAVAAAPAAGSSLPPGEPSHPTAPVSQPRTVVSRVGDPAPTPSRPPVQAPTVAPPSLGQTVSDVSQPVSDLVSQVTQTATQTVAQATSTVVQVVDQTTSTVSDVVSSIASPSSPGGASDASAPVQQTVSDVTGAVSRAVSQLLPFGK
jgi:RNA polymerase sigma factor (sigma-70 family)